MPPASLTNGSSSRWPASPFLALGGVWLGGRHDSTARSRRSLPTGEILGLTIGTPIAEARAKLDPLRMAAESAPDEKARSGKRLYWKLRETNYDWVMAWANDDGRITRLRAVLRPDHAKPFSEIGDLRTAASANDRGAKWNLRQRDGTAFRLIAHGAAGRAQTVYMFVLPRFNQEGDVEEPTEEED